MARPIDTDNVMAIINYMRENKAGELMGLSISQLADLLDLSDGVIRRIVTRPELGFRVAKGRNYNGAKTYFHDPTMMVAMGGVENPNIQPFMYDEEDKLVALTEYLVNALAVLNPGHEIIQKISLEGEKKKTSRQQRRNFFDWLFKDKTKELNYYTKVLNAKQLHENANKLLKEANLTDATDMEKYVFFLERIKSDVVHVENGLTNGLALVYYGILSSYNSDED